MTTQLDLIRALTGRHSPKVPAHIHSASKGGKVPGIRRENRRYPDGKPKVRTEESATEVAVSQVVEDQIPESAPSAAPSV